MYMVSSGLEELNLETRLSVREVERNMIVDRSVDQMPSKEERRVVRFSGVECRPPSPLDFPSIPSGVEINL